MRTREERQTLNNTLAYFVSTDEVGKVVHTPAGLESKQLFQKHYDEDGIHIWDSGQDCDGVRYGATIFVTCKDYAGFLKAYWEAARWAEGTFNWSIISKEDVKEANKSEYHYDTFAEAAGY